MPASPRASRLASATSFEMRATRSVDGGPRFNGTVAAPGWPAAPLLPVPRDPAPTVTSCDAPATPARESVGARVSARASTRADQEGSQAGGGHRAGAPFTERSVESSRRKSAVRCASRAPALTPPRARCQYLCRPPCELRLGFDRSMCARGAQGVSRRTQLYRPKMQPDPPLTVVAGHA